MKKIIPIISILTMVNMYALDISTNKNQDNSVKSDKSMGYNKNHNYSASQDKTKTKSNTSEKSFTTSSDLKEIGHKNSSITLMAFEYSNIEPFKTCSILTKPKLLNDFGLSCIDSRGLIDANYCSSLETASKYNFSIETVGGYEDDIKSFSACVGLYGGLIAQELKTGEFSPELIDEDIKDIFISFSETLEKHDCRFNGSLSNITCGPTIIKIEASPTLIYGNISLYSTDSFFGYSLSNSVNKASRVSDTYTKSKSKKRSEANSMAKSLNQNKVLSSNISESSASNLSMSKFLPNQ